MTQSNLRKFSCGRYSQRRLGGGLGVQLVAAATMVLVAGCGGGSGNVPLTSRYVDTALPTGAIGFYVEGTLAREAGDDAAALELFLSASREDERLILVNAALGEIYRERAQYSEAERYFRRLLRLDGNTAGNHFRLADLLMEMEQFNEALTSYLSGLRLDPDDGLGNLGAGRAYVALDRAGEAVTFLERAAGSMPESGETWLNLARAYAAAGNSVDAETAYRRSLETLPAPTAEALRGLGLSLLRQSKAAEALPYLREAVERDDAAEGHKLLGDAQLFAGDTAAAVSAYDVALAKDPQYVNALNAKGTARYRQYTSGGRLDQTLLGQAVDLWEQSLELQPDQPTVRATVERLKR